MIIKVGEAMYNLSPTIPRSPFDAYRPSTEFNNNMRRESYDFVPVTNKESHQKFSTPSSNLKGNLTTAAFQFSNLSTVSLIPETTVFSNLTNTQDREGSHVINPATNDWNETSSKSQYDFNPENDTVLDYNEDISTEYTTDHALFQAEGIIHELMEELRMLEKEHNCSVKTFLETTDLEDGEKAINDTRQHLHALQKLVTELKRINEESNVTAHRYIKNLTVIHNYETIINEKRTILRALESLQKLGMKINKFTDLLYKFKDHYEIYLHRYYDTYLLFDLVNGRKQQIETLKECIRAIGKLRTFLSANDLQSKFDSKSMKWLLDLVTWRKLLESLLQNLEHEENLYKNHNIFDFFKNVVAPVVMVIVFSIGIIGNGLLLTIFTRHEDMRTAPNLMLINLAFGEFLSLCFSIPTAYLYNLTAYGESFPLTCKICAFFRFQGIAISAYSLVGLSIQRYLLLSNSFEIRGFKTKGKLKSILFIWIFGSCVTIPNTIFAGEKNGYCFADSSVQHRRLTTMWNVVTLSLVPVLLNTIFSTIAVNRLKDSANHMPGENAGQGRVKQARKLTSKIILALTVVFACCYIPYFLSIFLYTWLNLSVEVLAYRYILFISYLLIFVNSCLNPIALYIMSPKYRYYFNKYLVCLKLRTSATVESPAISTSNVETQL